MKKSVFVRAAVIVLTVCLCISLGLISASAVEFDDLSYYDVSSGLGDIRLYLPHDVDAAVLQLQGDRLYNVSGNTIYLYCPQYPDYSFSAARFSPVTYRVSNYSSTELTVGAIGDSSQAVHLSHWEFLVVGLIIFLLILLLWRCLH